MNLNFNFEGNAVEISTETGNGYKYRLIMNGTVVYLKHKISTIASTKDDWVTHDAEACQYLARKYCGDDKPMSFLERLIMFVNNKLNVESEFDKLNKAFLEMETVEIKPYNVELPDYHFKPGYNDFVWNGYYKASELPIDCEYGYTCPVYLKVGYFDYSEVQVDNTLIAKVKSLTHESLDILTGKVNLKVNNWVSKLKSIDLGALAGKFKPVIYKSPVNWDKFVVKSRFANANGTPMW